MIKAYKTEINPNPEQATKILRTIGVCRFVYNLFIETVKQRYKTGDKYLSGYEFSKWLNHAYLDANPDKIWLKSVSSKAVMKSIMNADTAFKQFFKKQAHHPRFKHKGKSDPKMYFVNGNFNQKLPLIEVQRHKIKIPTLGWVRLKEKGYLPVNIKPISGTISIKAGRFYVSVLYDIEAPAKLKLNPDGIGIDLGVKELAAVSNGQIYPNINKQAMLHKLNKKLKRMQRSFSRKYERLKANQNIKKGKATRQKEIHKNIEKQRLQIQRLYQRIVNIRHDYQDKIIAKLVRTKPAYITIENLNVKGMLENKYLAKAVVEQELSRFRERLTSKANLYGIELRVVSSWYPSSKTCHNCGFVKHDLKLSDRTYICSVCGFTLDRDLNAALNLQDANEYQIA